MEPNRTEWNRIKYCFVEYFDGFLAQFDQIFEPNSVLLHLDDFFEFGSIKLTRKNIKILKIFGFDSIY
jgi:hypothetical protein